MIEALLGVIIQFVLEVLAQALFQVVLALGWASLANTIRPLHQERPGLAAAGHFLIGVCAGGLSLLISAHRLTPRSPVTGISLLLAPLGAGIVMSGLGDLWERRGHDRPALFSFRAGAICAVGMALVRFIYFETEWALF